MMYFFFPVGLFHAEDAEKSCARLRNDDFWRRLKIRLMCLLLSGEYLYLVAGFRLRLKVLLFENDSFAEN